jgi:hypothetical protein
MENNIPPSNNGYLTHILFGCTAIVGSMYFSYLVYKDRKEKGIIPIKNIKPGQRVSIEGRVRELHEGGNDDKGIYENNTLYYMM